MDRKIFFDTKTAMVQPHRDEPKEGEKSHEGTYSQTNLRSYVKGETNVTNLIQTKAELSYAIAVMEVMQETTEVRLEEGWRRMQLPKNSVVERVVNLLRRDHLVLSFVSLSVRSCVVILI